MSGRWAMTPEAAAEDFWDWSLEVYANPEVKGALLTLQDRHHLNVNLILWCIWAARRGWQFTPEQVHDMTNAVDQFSRYGIERLREVRRYLTSPKPGFDRQELESLRQDLLMAELKGERMTQTRLAHLTVERGGHPAPKSPDDMEEAARIHFANVGPSLEKPMLLADSHGSKVLGEMFDRLLALTASEEPA
ncbi:MAG: TIGR02444 family protein [Pseudomonadota bacterium]